MTQAASQSKLDDLVGKTVNVPPIPLVAKKVIELVEDPNVSTAIIKKAISSDQALAARVLRVANSAFYSPRTTVNDLGMAIMVLGFMTLKDIVVTASLKEVFRDFGLVQKMFWEHSVAVAVAGRIIAQRQHTSNPEETLVAGLLHDIGKVIMYESDEGRYREVMERVYNEHIPYLEAEEALFGFNHADVGVLLVKKWNFSLELGKVVHFHHSPDLPAIQPPEVARLVATVNLADTIARRLGIGHRQADESILPHEAASARLLEGPDSELSEAAIKEIIETFTVSFEKEKGIFM